MAESSGENAGELKSQPQFEIPNEPQHAGQEALTERAIEQKQIRENTATKQKPQFPTQAVAAPQMSSPTQSITQNTSATNLSVPTAKISAQDTDLIEKEWVERAKTIVAQTQDDPFRQKNEMSKIKADYIKKRFDKTIPVDDTAKS